MITNIKNVIANEYYDGASDKTNQNTSESSEGHNISAYKTSGIYITAADKNKNTTNGVLLLVGNYNACGSPFYRSNGFSFDSNITGYTNSVFSNNCYLNAGLPYFDWIDYGSDEIGNKVKSYLTEDKYKNLINIIEKYLTNGKNWIEYYFPNKTKKEFANVEFIIEPVAFIKYNETDYLGTVNAFLKANVRGDGFVDSVYRKMVSAFRLESRSGSCLTSNQNGFADDQTGCGYHKFTALNILNSGCVDGKYYINGKRNESFDFLCGDSKSCEYSNNKYYDKNGVVVSKEQYEKSCLKSPGCGTDGKYYDENGVEVPTMNYKCPKNPTCSSALNEFVNDHYKYRNYRAAYYDCYKTVYRGSATSMESCRNKCNVRSNCECKFLSFDGSKKTPVFEVYEKDVYVGESTNPNCGTKTIYHEKIDNRYYHGYANDNNITSSDRAALISLYNKYGYNGLLDFKNPTCSNVSCSYGNSSSCLSGDYGNNSSFYKNNLSCFTENINNTFCINKFSLTNNLGFEFSTKSGKMPIQYQNEKIAATGNLTRECYNSSGVSLNNSFNYSDYIKEITFNNKELVYDLEIPSCNSYSCSISSKYYLNPLYAQNGNGKISDSKQNGYKFLGYGIVSKLNEVGTFEIPYSLNINGHKFGFGSIASSNRQCQYTVKPELMPKLNLEFREVDTKNPFPGKSGNNNRIVGTNWNSRAVDYNVRFQQEIQNYINTHSEWVFSNDNKYDINRDGKVNNEDLKIAKWITNNYYVKSREAVSNKSNNSLIAYVMQGRNNSFNQTKEGPIYSIKLTSSTIKAIQEYNNSNPYDDYNLECDENGENCKSNFLKNLRDGKINGKSGYDKLIKK